MRISFVVINYKRYFFVWWVGEGYRKYNCDSDHECGRKQNQNFGFACFAHRFQLTMSFIIYFTSL